MEKSELMNLCYSCLIDGCDEYKPITKDEAEYTLKCWQEEENELAEETEGLTVDEFMKAWNAVYAELVGIKENIRNN